MSIFIYVAGFIGAFIFIPALVWFIWWNKSFVHKMWIAKQSGKEVTDVIWIEDKFKVVDKGGEHIIILKRHHGKTPSFKGEFWAKVFKVKNTVINIDSSEWTVHLRKHLGRGMFVYQSTEGEFHPMSILEAKGDLGFKILPQDNRGFIIRSMSQTNELSLNSHKQMIIYLAIVGAFVILVIAFVLWLIYMTESASNLCGVTGKTFSETAKNVVVGG